MSRSILLAEWRLLTRERAFVVAGLFLLVLTALAASLGAARTDIERRTIAAARQTEAQQRAVFALDAAAVERMSPSAAALVQPIGEAPGQPFAGAMAGPIGLKLLPVAAALDPADLGFLAVGLSDVRPSIYLVTASPPHRFMTSYELDNPLLISLGALDVAFVFLFLLPIVVLAGNYNLIAADRDAGVMAMILAQPVNPAVYVGARVLVRGSAVVCLVVAIWADALLFGDASLQSSHAMVGAGLLLSILLIYAAFWMALALGVNVLFRSAATCGLILAGVWLAFVVVVPAAVSLMADNVVQGPSRVALTADTREAAQQAEKHRAKLLSSFYVDHPEFAAPSMPTGAGDVFSKSVLLADAAVSKAIAPRLAAFDQASRRRQALVHGLQALSPALIMQIAIEDIAGRGNTRYATFNARMLAFNVEWSAFFTSRIMAQGRLGTKDYGAMPRWQALDADRWPIGALNGVMVTLSALLTATITMVCFRALRMLAPE